MNLHNKKKALEMMLEDLEVQKLQFIASKDVIDRLLENSTAAQNKYYEVKDDLVQGNQEIIFKLESAVQRLQEKSMILGLSADAAAKNIENYKAFYQEVIKSLSS